MNKLKMQFYTYTHARPNGEPFYVGKGSNGRSHNFDYSRNPHHKNIVLKYGKENIIITILPMETERDAFEVEKYLIEEYRKAGFRLCNMTEGGEGSAGFSRPEIRAKLSAAKKGKPWSMARRKLDDMGLGKRKARTL